MTSTNQERFKLGLPQIIIEDTEYKGIPLRLEGQEMVEALNKETLDSMYRIQEAVYRLFGLCEIRERQANTVNPAQQNLFIPLKVWNIRLGGCYVEVSIYQRVLDGCYAEMKIL